jgi:hypothetical protein
MVDQTPREYPQPPTNPTTEFERQYTAWFITKAYAPDAPRPTIKLRMDVCRPFDGKGTWVKVTDLAEAEKYFISLITADPEAVDLTAYYSPRKFTFCGGDGVSPFIIINRGGNLCAAKTRRGRGNVVMMNHATALDLFERRTTSAMCAVSDVSFGGKPVSFIINDSMYVIEDERVPTNIVSVLYKGMEDIAMGIQFDAPAHYLSTSTGNYLFMRETFAANECTHWRAFFKTYHFQW